MDGFGDMPLMENGADEEVTTIRVINVPSHTTDTEFNCWFLFAQGFEGATLVPTRGPDQSQLGWAKFVSFEAAQAAVQTLHGRALTEDQSPEGIVLQADFARSNYKPGSGGRKRTAPMAGMGMGMPSAVAGSCGAFGQQGLQPPGPPKMNPPAMAPPSGRARCSTLFLGGLQEGVLEQELSILFANQCQGFERMKFVQPMEGRPGMAWAKFFTPEYAEASLNTIVMGVTLPSAPGFQLQAEFAKNDLDQPPPGARMGGMGGMGMDSPVSSFGGQPQYGGAPPPLQVSRPTADGTTPGDTMFVGCLPQGITDQELNSIFLQMPGFVRTKLVAGPRPVAFALFDSTDNCNQAIGALNGAALPSNPTQPITCEFSKNSLDKRQRIM